MHLPRAWSGRLNRRPALWGRTFWRGTMVWLFGMCRKGKRQRNQWKDDPRSVGSVHFLHTPFGRCATPNAYAYLRAPFSRQV